ncbi:DUF302 domain-containing protein [Nocardioidaceae bacterium]|nr:DUF302 domain-containing protein [Nocardioidaceae bacterium]
MCTNRVLLTTATAALAVSTLAACGSSAEPEPPRPGTVVVSPSATGSTSATASPSATGSSSPSTDPTTAGVPQVPGLVVHASEYDVPETVSRLQSALGGAGTVVATLDHAENAASVGMSLPPTVLVVGGNAEVGTPVLQQESEAGLELPLRFLAWEEDGQVYLAYNSADYLAERADLDDAAGRRALEPVRQASAMLAETASGTTDPLTDGSRGLGDDDREVEDVDADSDRAVAATQSRLRQALQRSPLSIVAVVDHAANARSIGRSLTPLRLTLAGNPEAGTPFIAARRTIGIDLPMRFLVAADGDGDGDRGGDDGDDRGSEILAPDFSDLVDRHGITGLDEAVAAVERSQEQLLRTATR